jgi:nitrile hydratase
MSDQRPAGASLPGIRRAAGEEPVFQPGDWVRIGTRTPVGHYRVPTYVRGKRARVERVVEPAAVNNEEEGFGRNAGSKLHYYRVGIPLAEVWPGYSGPAHDYLHIEVYETWLEKD